jgi:intermediate cleaving peptidase 55
MRFAKPGMSEAALAAHFEYICALGGSQRPAYVPVVASGSAGILPTCSLRSHASRANSLIIHYVSNNQIIQPDEMVLFDGGCEYKFREASLASFGIITLMLLPFSGYASDISGCS